MNNKLKRFPFHLLMICLFSGEVSNHGKGGELDILLDGIALTGAFLAILVMIRGAANMVMMAMMWMLYMSIVNVGQTWFSFGWESQLLETGFLAIWAVPILSLSRYLIFTLYFIYSLSFFPKLSLFKVPIPSTLAKPGCLGKPLADIPNHDRSRLDQDEGRPVLERPHLHELLLPDPAQPKPPRLLCPSGS